jgi:hypothetical protein
MKQHFFYFSNPAENNAITRAQTGNCLLIYCTELLKIKLLAGRKYGQLLPAESFSQT